MEKVKLNREKVNRLIRIIRDDLGLRQQRERQNLREETARKNIQGQGAIKDLFEIQIKEISIAYLDSYIDSIEKHKYVGDDILKIIIQHIASFVKNESEAFYVTLQGDLVRKGASKEVIESTKRGVSLIANRTLAYCRDVLNIKIDSINDSLSIQKQKTSKNNNTFGEKMDYWGKIKEDFDVTKKTFGKKINFIQNKFSRKVIFRDIEQAYILCKSGYYKPSVLLAGGVIEELLRQYLQFKNVSPRRNTFDEYLKACEENGLLKSAIRQLSDSVRQFRNVVHIAKEESPKHTISKATAWAAVSVIFTISNDF